MRAPHPAGGALFFRRSRSDEIEALHEMSVREIGPDVASLAVMQRVQRHNPDSLWSILRAANDEDEPLLAGYYGFLFLNSAGCAALAANQFDTRDVDLTLLAPAGKRPAAIYIWAVVARKLRALIAPLLREALPAPLYSGLPLVARAGTAGGLLRLNQVAAAEGNDGAKAVGDVFRIDISRTAVLGGEVPPQ